MLALAGASGAGLGRLAHPLLHDGWPDGPRGDPYDGLRLLLRGGPLRRRDLAVRCRACWRAGTCGASSTWTRSCSSR
jgi:hypothetical protein